MRVVDGPGPNAQRIPHPLGELIAEHTVFAIKYANHKLVMKKCASSSSAKRASGGGGGKGNGKGQQASNGGKKTHASGGSKESDKKRAEELRAKLSSSKAKIALITQLNGPDDLEAAEAEAAEAAAAECDEARRNLKAILDSPPNWEEPSAPVLWSLSDARLALGQPVKVPVLPTEHEVPDDDAE